MDLNYAIYTIRVLECFWSIGQSASDEVRGLTKRKLCTVLEAAIRTLLGIVPILASVKPVQT